MTGCECMLPVVAVAFIILCWGLSVSVLFKGHVFDYATLIRMSSHANGVIRPVFEDCGISIVVKDFPDKDNLQGALLLCLIIKWFLKKGLEKRFLKWLTSGIILKV